MMSINNQLLSHLPTATAMANPSFGQQVVINFAISSKLCQDKGNILQHTFIIN